VSSFLVPTSNERHGNEPNELEEDFELRRRKDTILINKSLTAVDYKYVQVKCQMCQKILLHTKYDTNRTLEMENKT